MDPDAALEGIAYQLSLEKGRGPSVSGLVPPKGRQLHSQFSIAVGDRVRRFRGNLELTQEQLGAAVGVSRQHVSKWETGSSAPSLEMLRRLGKALGCTPGELIPE